jgi:hypothetical protein
MNIKLQELENMSKSDWMPIDKACIITPHIGSFNDTIDLHISKVRGNLCISDGGETLSNLELQKKHFYTEKIKYIAYKYGVRLKNRELVIESSPSQCFQKAKNIVAAIERITNDDTRTGIDFSRHVITVEKSEKPFCQIHHFKRPDTTNYSATFTTCNGTMSVTGDFGLWIFSKPWVPSSEGAVSDSYWVEKLGSEGLDFDGPGTEKEIKEGLNGGLEEYGYEGEDLKTMKEYYSTLLDYVESEHEYVTRAYYDYIPDIIDSEDVPFVQCVKPYLRAVFDAFDAMCNKMKNELK